MGLKWSLSFSEIYLSVASHLSRSLAWMSGCLESASQVQVMDDLSNLFFQSIDLDHELGKGQFGAVFQGDLKVLLSSFSSLCKFSHCLTVKLNH